VGGGGWILGHKIDGTQAEYVRVPFADTSIYPVPVGVADEELLIVVDFEVESEHAPIGDGGTCTKGE
jgi:threonine dehydrogenase-like Zn-dependent dehydrogenase